MTEERDPKISKRYRGLGREEPPRELDERILAASRRAGRPDRYRWAAPLATAAILVLAVGVALHVEREQPKESVARVEVPKAPEPAASPPAFTPEPKAPQPSREMRARPEARSAPAPEAAPAQPVEAAPQERAADQLSQDREEAAAAVAEARAKSEMAARRDAQSGARVEAQRPQAALAKAQQSPEQWLERIVQLRIEGKDDEADRQLAEFRRVYPDYRYSEELKAKVERPGASYPARR